MHPIHERPRDGCVWHRRRYSAGGSHSSSAGTGRSGAGGWRAREAPPVRRRAGPAQRAGGAEDEVSLARFWRRTYLGHVSRRPPDGGRLGLRSACPANTSSTSSASTSDSLGSSAAAATTMLRLPVFTGAGEPGNGMALRRHRPAVHPRVRITRDQPNVCSRPRLRRDSGGRALRSDERLSPAIGRQVPEVRLELLAGERRPRARRGSLPRSSDRWFERRAALLVWHDVTSRPPDFEHVADVHHEPVHVRVYGQSIRSASSLAPSSTSRLRFRCLYSPLSSPIQLTVRSCGSTINSSSTWWAA